MDDTHSTRMGKLTITVPCMEPATCPQHAPLINCRHETDGTGEWTCNLPEYVCDYSEPAASLSDVATGNSAEVTSSENAAMAEGMAGEQVRAQIRALLPRSVRGMVVQDTRTGMWGTVNTGIEWAMGPNGERQTVVRIQETVTDLQWWAPTSALVII